MRTIKGPKSKGAEWKRMRAWGASPKVRLGSINFPCGVVDFFDEDQLFPELDLQELPIASLSARLINYGFTKNQTEALLCLVSGSEPQEEPVRNLSDWRNAFEELVITMRHDEVLASIFGYKYFGDLERRDS